MTYVVRAANYSTGEHREIATLPTKQAAIRLVAKEKKRLGSVWVVWWRPVRK